MTGRPDLTEEEKRLVVEVRQSRSCKPLFSGDIILAFAVVMHDSYPGHKCTAARTHTRSDHEAYAIWHHLLHSLTPFIIILTS